MSPETARAGPRGDAVTGSQDAACLEACGGLNATDGRITQDAIAARSASPEAIAAARDVTFEALVDTASLAESYSRSLAEAAWRADAVTVEVHLRQLRSCVVGAIDVFKALRGVEQKGGGA